MPKSLFFYENYLFGYLDTQQLLRDSKESPRIILLGGSSLGLGVSAKELTTHLGIATYNVGLHAGIGYQNIVEDNIKYLDPLRDIIIVSPEYGSFKKNFVYHRIHCGTLYVRRSLLELFKFPRCIRLVIQKSTNDIIKRYKNIANLDLVYHRDAFNEFRDVVSHHDVDDAKIKQEVELGQFNTDEYYTYINDTLISKGFRVLYIPVVVPESYCKNFKSRKKLQLEIMKKLNQVRQIEKSQLCFPDELFFDTVYHLRKKGIKLKTAIFERDISDYLSTINIKLN